MKRVLLVYQTDSLKHEVEETLQREGISLFPLDSIDKLAGLLSVDPHFNLVLIESGGTDVKLVTTIEQLKERKETRIIPVVLLLDEENIVDQLTILETGADDFFTVPINPIYLQLKVRTLIHLLETRQVLQEKTEALDEQKEIQKIVATLSHYINNAITPASMKLGMHLQLKKQEIDLNELFNLFQYIGELLRVIGQISTQTRLKTVEDGVYKGFLMDVEQEVERIKKKYNIK